MPLTYTHFFGYLLLSCGTGELIGELIRMQTINIIGISLISLGFGVICGNNLAVRKSKSGNKTVVNNL